MLLPFSAISWARNIPAFRSIGGTTINTDGTWYGHVQAVLTASDGQLMARVPPTTAYLLIPNVPPLRTRSMAPKLAPITVDFGDAFLVSACADGTGQSSI